MTISRLQLMQAASFFQNPRVVPPDTPDPESGGEKTGPTSAHTGENAPGSVEQTEGKTPAVRAARGRDRELRGE